MVSAAVAHLPAAVSLLLLAALFMQISGVRLALTWPRRLCLPRVLCVNYCYTLSLFQAHWRRWHCTHFLWPACLFKVHMGSGSSPPLLWSFPPSATHKISAPGCWACAPAPSLSGKAWLVYLQFQEGFSSPTSVLRAPHPLCHKSLLFLLVITQFLFSPRLGVFLSRGLCWSGPGLSVEVPRIT
jgi:hypothetical protein